MCGQRFHYIVSIWGKYAERKLSARISDWNVHLKLRSWLTRAVVCFFFPVFHPGGTMLRVHQARCCHDIYLVRSKALHKVPGMDMILWTNFIIVTPLTSGHCTNNEFGSSYPKWSLTSFILSFPFYLPPLLPPAITLWVRAYHRLQTAMSKLCPHSKLTEAMWLHWHQAWANNPSWEGFYFNQ